MLGDAADPRRADGELLLDTERVALQALFDMVRRFSVGHDVRAAQAHGGERPALARRPGRAPGGRRRGAAGRSSTRTSPARSAGRSVRLVGTDDGVDVLCDADAVGRRRRRTASTPARSWSTRPRPRCCASSAGGRATASISTTASIPQEAGLNERAVSFTKGCYVGQETVARLHYKGKPNRHLRGLRLSAAAEPGAPLIHSAIARSGASAARSSPPPRPDRASRSFAARPQPGATVARRRRAPPPRSSSCRSSRPRRGWAPLGRH